MPRQKIWRDKKQYYGKFESGLLYFWLTVFNLLRVSYNYWTCKLNYCTCKSLVSLFARLD